MSITKTAISIDEGLFQKAEELSSKLQVSRSQLFSQAIEYLINRNESLEIIQKLNAIYGSDTTEPSPIVKAAKKKMKSLVEKW